MRKFIIAGNWKMNFDVIESLTFVKELTSKLAAVDINNTDIVIAPTFTALYPVSDSLKNEGNKTISVGSQNIFWEKSGAYTGEISADMLISSGVEYTIIGHSERRQYFGETNETINNRIKASFENSLKPIFCIGETLEERESGNEKSVVSKQIKEGLLNFSAKDLENLVIAYEPVWAIGTGKTATPEQAEEMHSYIRSIISEMYGSEFAEALRIQYGGSLNLKNAQNLLSKPNIDGGLIGGASLKAIDFSEIIKIASSIKK